MSEQLKTIGSILNYKESYKELNIERYSNYIRTLFICNVFLWRVVINKLLSLGPSRHMSFGLSSEGLPESKLKV